MNCFVFRYPGTTTKTVNLASYNYLGFAENSGPCADAAEQAVREYGIAGCSSRHEYGESKSERYSFVRERLTAVLLPEMLVALCSVIFEALSLFQI